MGVGEPRLLYHYANASRVRVYLCSGCAAGATAPAGQVLVCAREKVAIETAFAEFYRRPVAAHEVICRLRGNEECEFEVKH